MEICAQCETISITVITCQDDCIIMVDMQCLLFV